MTRLFIDDTDFRLYVGDAREALALIPEGSIDCMVTSPPYWGLRDYGVDRQIGLEQTYGEYVEQMVEVFRGIRRVLADHGTCWLNLGDSYVSVGTGTQGENGEMADRTVVKVRAQVQDRKAAGGAIAQRPPSVAGLKQKDLVGIPWRVALALQDDGWYLRADIIWSKPNPMPESVTDRPTKAHEYVFMLAKQQRYYFDQEAVREPFETSRPPGRAIKETDHYGGVGGNGNRGLSDHLADVHTRLADERRDPAQPTLDEALPPEAPRGPDGRRATAVKAGDGSLQHRDGERWPNGGRNVRTVWEIATQPYAEAHFATFPEALPERCIKAGCPEWVCVTCGKPRERVVERTAMVIDRSDRTHERGQTRSSGTMLAPPSSETVGWTDCGHDNWRPGVVLDPFMGSGTTALVARKLGRHAVGIELNPEYAALCGARTQQQSLLA